MNDVLLNTFVMGHALGLVTGVLFFYLGYGFLKASNSESQGTEEVEFVLTDKSEYTMRPVGENQR